MGCSKEKIIRVRYDQRTPCKDCPFKTDTQLHDGVGAEIGNHAIALAFGEERYHTCHKTDPRSDSPDGQKHKGPMQHCAGFLIMLVKSGLDLPSNAVAHGVRPEKLNLKAPVYKLDEMLRRYAVAYSGAHEVRNGWVTTDLPAFLRKDGKR